MPSMLLLKFKLYVCMYAHSCNDRASFVAHIMWFPGYTSIYSKPEGLYVYGGALGSKAKYGYPLVNLGGYLCNLINNGSLGERFSQTPASPST